MFLVRRHLDMACVRFDTLWWEQVSHHSKRDQLSFDFVRWLTATPVLTLPFRYTQNAVFAWGTHRTAQRCASEHIEHATRRDGASFPFLVADYDARFERWPPGFIARLHELNSVVHATGERLEGNLCYFDSAPDYLNAPPDPRRGRRRENFLRALAGRARVLELGFNAGHSALLALSHSSVHFTAIDIASHGYTERAAVHLAQEFGGRFRFIRMDTRAIHDRRAELELASFDLVHVDGGHGDDVYANDILSVLHLCTPGTRVLIDDFYVHGITAMTQRLVKEGFLDPYGDLGTHESAAFTIVKTYPVGAGQSFSAVVKDFQLSTLAPVDSAHSASSFGSESSSA
jgi:predicted O-methyltransferase YrrM